MAAYNSRPLFCVVFYILITLQFRVCQQNDGPIVQTQKGPIQGKISSTPQGRQFYSFQGIPFAKPPTGDLRFRVSIIFHIYHCKDTKLKYRFWRKKNKHTFFQKCNFKNYRQSSILIPFRPQLRLMLGQKFCLPPVIHQNVSNPFWKTLQVTLVKRTAYS